MPETSHTPNRTHRRWLLVATGGCALAAAAVYLLRDRNVPAIPAAPVPSVVDGGQLTTASDGVEIFQRAFWKRPRPEDKILHAERREWTSETDGVRQWEWFLAIEPGPGLVEDIRARYSLHPTALQTGHYASAPAWMREAVKPDFTALTSDGQGMTLALSPDGRTLLATGRGNGFARAVTDAR